MGCVFLLDDEERKAPRHDFKVPNIPFGNLTAFTKMIVHSKISFHFCQDCKKFREGEWEQPWHCSSNLVVIDALLTKAAMANARVRVWVNPNSDTLP
jgi:hypothetical protein